MTRQDKELIGHGSDAQRYPLIRAFTRRDILASMASSVVALSTRLPAGENVQPGVPRHGTGRWKARSAILIYLHGGASHIDLWDPKANLPASMRSPFRSIPTRLDGVEFTEVIPRLATSNDLFTTIRSMTCRPSGLFFHDAAVHQMLTGQFALNATHAGQLASIEVCASQTVAPAIESRPIPMRDALPLRSFARSKEHRVSELLGGVSKAQSIDTPRRDAVTVPVRPLPSADRERYGINAFGESLLSARTLAETSECFIEVHWPWRTASSLYSWDLHENLTESMKRSALILDQGLAALFRDLDQRGLLEETLVAAVSEFGRCPQKGMSTSGNGNSIDGRDHWPYCFSAVMGGAGVKRGFVYGESDETASYPVKDPVSPADLLATIWHIIGLPPNVPERANDTGLSQLQRGSVVTGLLI